jgi:hypothetical protein
MRGYGQFGIDVDVVQVAQQSCAMMNGQWNPESYECTVAGQVIALPGMQPSALPPPTPPTAAGCPAGQVMSPGGCIPLPGDVPAPPPPPPPAPAPAPASTEGPDWVLPAVIGVGAVAVLALVMANK